MFEVNYPSLANENVHVEFVADRITFLLGANGTGKSSLMDLISQQNPLSIERIYAHRNVTLEGSSISITGNDRAGIDSNFQHVFATPTYRYKNSYAGQAVSTVLFDIHAAETKFVSDQLKALKAADVTTIEGQACFEKSKTELSPFQRLERALRAAGLRFSVSVDERGTINVTRNGCPPYGIEELSDGERSAFLLSAAIITARPNRLILIDEPERHLHRSISSPLIHALLADRGDCAFVISTHDIGLAIDQRECAAILLRSYSKQPQAWASDYIPKVEEIDDSISGDILGSRRIILFVEGNNTSLDCSLYSILFENVSVRPQDSCIDVINATKGVNRTKGEHWIRAVGLVDRDRRSEDDIAKLAADDVHALQVHAVESLYYNPKVIRLIAKRLELAGLVKFSDIDAYLDDILLNKFASAEDVLVKDAVARSVRNAALSKLPQASQLGGPPFPHAGLTAEAVEEIFLEERRCFQTLVQERKVEELVSGYAVKKSGIIRAICDLLKIKDAAVYGEIVRKMVIDDEASAREIRELIGPITQKIKEIRIVFNE